MFHLRMYYNQGQTNILRRGKGSTVMDWRLYIHSDPKVLQGKPVVKGTRLSVDFILGLFAAGWDEEMVLRNYPALTSEAIRAVFAFAQECNREATVYDVTAA